MLPTLALFSSLVASAVVCATDIDAPRRADIEAMLNDFERNNAVWYSLERNDYAAALELASPLAERGSAIAMYVMGELRMVGTELDGDPAVAVALAEKVDVAKLETDIDGVKDIGLNPETLRFVTEYIPTIRACAKETGLWKGL